MKRKNLSQLQAHPLEMVRALFENLLPLYCRVAPLDSASVIDRTHNREFLICTDRPGVHKVGRVPHDAGWGGIENSDAHGLARNVRRRMHGWT
jgi:hypothetical protein